MSRIANPDSQYRVSVHILNGYRYASTQPYVVDAKTAKKVYRHIHWGTLTEDNKFIPGKNYLLATVEERAKLIFPEDWDLREINKLSGRRAPGRPVIETQDGNRLYGDVWLLEQIAEVTGIRQDLIKVFNGDIERVDIIMTLSFYLLLGKGAYNQLSGWQRIAKTPSSINLTSPFITTFTQSITEQNRMDLLRLRAARLGEKSLCAVDSTSRTAWGESLADIRYGKNKEHLPLPQTLEVVVYTLDEHMPVYYRTFPGNTPDSRSLETILEDLAQAGFKNVVLITDRGYETIRNLELYIDKGQPMIMASKVGQSHVLKEIKELGTFDHHPDKMEIDLETRIYSYQYDLEYQIEGKRDNIKKADRLKLNLYFNPIRRSFELTELDVAIATQKASLEEIKEKQLPLDDDKTIRRVYCYYELSYDEKTRVLKSYKLNSKKVENKKITAGYFANTTHKVDFTSMEAHKHYKLRDEQEKYFSMMKGMMSSDRQRNWSEAGKTGRLFILFIAQIIGCYLSNIRVTKLKDDFDSVYDVLNEMRPIRYIEHPNTKSFITPFVGKQIKICEAFGFNIPEGCAPEYVVRKTTKGQRGRPKKNKVVILDS